MLLALEIPDYESKGLGWGGNLPDVSPPVTEDTNNVEFLRNFNLLERLAIDAKMRGIHLLLFNCPQSPAYKTTAYAGRYGPTWSRYSWLLGKIQRMEQGNDHFHFYDAHLNGNHDYMDSSAMNCDHLAISGLRKLGTRLDSVVTKILQ